MEDKYLIVFWDTTQYKTDEELESLLGKLTPTDSPLNKPKGSIAINVSELNGKTAKQKRKVINEAFKWKSILERKAVIIFNK